MELEKITYLLIYSKLYSKSFVDLYQPYSRNTKSGKEVYLNSTTHILVLADRRVLLKVTVKTMQESTVLRTFAQKVSSR